MIVMPPPPPAIVSQVPHQAIFRDDFSRGCPGYSQAENQQIGNTAANHLAGITKNKTDSLVIFFTREFTNFQYDPFSGRQDPQEGERLDRFFDFINGSQIPNKRYVYFCVNTSDFEDRNAFSQGFWGPALQQIGRLANLDLRQPGVDHVMQRLGLVHIGTIKRGYLYYVLPRSN
ncbi:hypothetical protein [Planktothrix agardhii]|uniref:hypothetical protein n=1 Tax=Planktothrix agardhii TaxID=1160 RepID=UPI00048182A5|nr:hypothetical protein [Planktothrix agardhii]